MATKITELRDASQGYTEKTNQKFASYDVVRDAPGESVFMSGAEAIARGAVEAGCALSASFPGSPSTWIQENMILASKVLEPFHVEWSTNEAKAFDVALGAALMGKRTLCPIKQVGVNWIVDTLTDWTIKRALQGGLVIVCGDDPGADTTAEEQDTRLLGPFFEIPILSASSVPEQRDLTAMAFDLSEELRTPVMVVITRQQMYGRGAVELREINHERRAALPDYQKDAQRGYTWSGSLFATTGIAMKHQAYHDLTIERAKELANENPLNEIVRTGTPKLAIVTAEQAFVYTEQALEHLELQDQIGLVKLVNTYPLPRKLIERVLTEYENVLVIEELEPFIEDQIRVIASSMPSHAKIWGKGDETKLKPADAFNFDIVATAIAAAYGVDYQPLLSDERRASGEELRATVVPDRPFSLCPGCPELGALHGIKDAIKESTFNRNDIISVVDEGCYDASESPPWSLGDFMTCLGSAISLAHGIFKSGTDKKIFVQVGDGGFLHNGVQGLMNAVHNGAKMTILIHDNKSTAATGQQGLPSGLGFNVAGDAVPVVDFEALVRACGVEWVKRTNPYDIKTTTAVILEALEHDAIAVVISDAPCALIETRRVGSRGEWGGTKSE